MKKNRGKLLFAYNVYIKIWFFLSYPMVFNDVENLKFWSKKILNIEYRICGKIANHLKRWKREKKKHTMNKMLL